MKKECEWQRGGETVADLGLDADSRANYAAKADLDPSSMKEVSPQEKKKKDLT